MKTFDDATNEYGLTFKISPEPDGACEIEQEGNVIDISWGWGGKSWDELQKIDPACIWTVLDCEDKLYIANGLHFVNRLYYLVANEPYNGHQKVFIF